MKKIILIVVFLALFFDTLSAQQPNRPILVADFPVNYDENLAGDYDLPDLLSAADGKRITSAKDWMKKRRPELLKMVQEIEHGKMPEARKKSEF